jgi:hypothetical protein
MMRYSLRRATMLGLIFFLSFGMAAASHAQSKVKISGFEIDVRGKEPPVPQELQPLEERRLKKWIVQFAGPIFEPWKNALTSLGADIGDYLPEFAFIVTMDNNTKKKVEKLSFVNGVVRYKPAYKINQGLKAENGSVRIEDKKHVKLHIRVDDPKNQGLVLAQLKKSRVLETRGAVLKVDADPSEIAGIAQIEEVVWIEKAAELRLQNDTTKWVIQTDQVGNTSIWDKGLHGERQIVGVGDSGLDYDMPWFRDSAGVPFGPSHRKIQGYDITYGDEYDADSPGHGTHVAGTLGGDSTPIDGRSSYNGMAPKSRLFIQDISPGSTNSVYPPLDLGLLFIAAYNAGARIHTNSWGGGDNSYGTFAATADSFLWEHKDFLALFANGNAGPGINTVINPATAKNVISVGATLNGSGAENVASFSSHGSTWDGRIKPTVCAPGDGISEGAGIISADSDGIKDSYNSGTIAMRGTSMATPAVAGAAALARQYFMDGYYPTGAANAANAFTPSAALIKAFLINSAQNMTGIYSGGSIPGTGQGWGRINLSNVLTDGQALEVADVSTGLSTNDSWSREVFPAAGRPLKVTLVWTDYPGAEGASKALVNDLDLTVTGPDGTIYVGNAFTNGSSVAGGSPDRLNVEEQVLVEAPKQGLYKIQIHGYNVPYGPQPFAMVLTGASSVTSKGSISLDKGNYNAAGTLTIRVLDRDLNKNANLLEDVQVLVKSTTEPSGEVVWLHETGPDTTVFTGTLPLRQGAPNAGNRYLEIAEGDIVTAAYADADDGTGNPAVVYATATIDLTPPTISQVKVASVGETAATISWTTDEPAASALDYGLTKSGGSFVSDALLTTEHQLSISPLQENATYYFGVAATDEAGNLARDDNDGTLYSITTLNAPPSLTVYSSNWVKTYSESTDIYGSAEDPSGVASIMVNGKPASFKPIDSNYELQALPTLGTMSYQLSVPLNYGDNTFSVVATDKVGNAKESTITVTRLQVPAAGPDYTITATATTGGSIYPAGAVPIVAGGTQVFSFTPNPGYKVSYIAVNGVTKSAASSYTFTNVNANQTIAVAFEIITYTVVVTQSANGTITPVVKNINIPAGTTKTYSITPNNGYHVDTLTVDGQAITPATSYTFTNIQENHSISATFAANPSYIISASAGTGGAISPSGSVSVTQGFNQYFAITSDKDYGIANVVVDGVSKGALNAWGFLNVTGPHTIAVSFAPIYTITASAGTGGSISPSGTVKAAGGTNQYVYFQPSTGYRVKDVVVDGVSKGAITFYTFSNVSASHTIAVSFVPTITASAGTGGSISPSGTTAVPTGSLTYTITPSTGYHVKDVLLNGTSVGAVTSYSFTGVTTPQTIAASFELNPSYNITASAGTGGSISPAGTVSVTGGGTQYFYITPSPGYSIANVVVDGVSKGAPTVWGFLNITGPHTIAATFAPNYTITASSGPGGSISPSGSVSVTAGTNKTFYFSQNTGYRINDVQVDGVSQGAVSFYTFSNISGPHTISVSYVATITATSGAGGTISPAGTTTIPTGSKSYTITPYTGNSVKDVLVNGTSVGAVTSYSFVGVTTPQTIAVTFSN